MMIRRIEQSDRAEWLRLRGALWPACVMHALEAETADILADPEHQSVFVAVRPTGSTGDDRAT